MTSSSSDRLPGAYWRLWGASAVSNLGDGIFLVALPLLAARLTRNEVSISLIGVFVTLPWLLLALPIGALVDRGDRRRIMIRADLARAVMVAVMAVVILVDQAEIWMLWVLALGLGLTEVFFDNAAQALLPSVVPSQQLETANGLQYSTEFVANTFLGTPLGSILFVTAVWLPFGIYAGGFLIAAGLIASLHGSFRAPKPSYARHSLYAETRSGLRWLWQHRLLRSLAIALGLANLGFQASQAVFVLFAQDVLGVGEGWFGVLVGAMGVGGVLGGLLASRLVARFGQVFALYTAIVVWATSLVAVGAIAVVWFIMVAAAVQAFAVTVWNVVTVSLRQQIVPNHLFGRVNSVYRWFGWGTMPLGALLGGQVAHHFGLRAPYFVGAAVVVAGIAVLARNVTPGTLAAAREESRDRSSDPTPVEISRDDWDD